MPIPIEMPRLSDTMEEGTLIKWHKSVGDEVSAGETIADVETDKATMELQAFDDGTIARIDIEEGSTVPVGETILILAGEGESVEDAAKAEGGKGGGGKSAEKQEDSQDEEKSEQAEAEQEQAEQQPAEEKTQTKAKSQDGGPGHKHVEDTGKDESTDSEKAEPSSGIRISPLARKLADEHGLDINQIEGSGPEGRIIKRDVLAAAEGKGAKKAPSQAGAERS
ncbi:MAG: biotin/lipoyl-containing protein [Phycisphaeraceae bacterium]